MDFEEVFLEHMNKVFGSLLWNLRSCWLLILVIWVVSTHILCPVMEKTYNVDKAW